MLNSPNGPLTVTVGRCCSGVRRPTAGFFGYVILSCTSSGIDNGAFPICDCEAEDAENARVVWKAGTRKAGIEEEVVEEATANAVRRVVESMAMACREN